ncbi:hypothetical protein Bcav_3521 [Beutenbergia cavernae DSM 12333]|uniref:Nitroreductase domain-containing protein n=1 Tax=Beutenbergia cavernae (strain ATCC BAA-8 / DSM 12333 / CCUG 43141 / JCM 11478 / NBRC 16432 / NCIMB 13614 / HKI 0122) TaxID=471853 RepID=C5C2R9_BEUC1|nr:hypothetical protein [Beutenbergia cavernae]ACQ81763.1 hypothetical protein Bcav_3521 [Beutenbergia cavernae DSM 12333]
MSHPAPSPWPEILDDARHYPSPHNSQPIKVRPLDAERADVFYDLDLGLPAESFGIPFGHVCAGVFLHGLGVVARARGWRVVEELDDADMDFAAADRLHRIGRVTLVPASDDDGGPSAAQAAADHRAFLERRTSRRPYTPRLVGPEVLDGAARLAADAGHALGVTADPAHVKALVHINQRTLFDDLRNDAVYGEIMHWLRFTKAEAAATGDGLSAETMLVPGRVLRFAMRHRGLWDAPVVGALIRSVYLRTMRGVRQLAWLTGPFDSPHDYLEAGRVFLGIWLHLERNGAVLHPFGTVITNPRSHAAFVERLGIAEADGRMAWMLFRLGHSPEPPLAHRRPLASTMLEPGTRQR